MSMILTFLSEERCRIVGRKFDLENNKVKKLRSSTVWPILIDIPS